MDARPFACSPGRILLASLLVAAAVSAVEGKTLQRPIEEFVAAQGTFCSDFGAGPCNGFAENFLGWTDPAKDLFMSMDYAGIAGSWLEDQSGGAISLGTSFEGSVRDRALADGTSQVHVVLHTNNALSWVSEGLADILAGDLRLGHRADAVLAGAEAVVGDSTLHVTFINTEQGAPLPDLMQLIFDPLPGQDLFSGILMFHGQADGALHEAEGIADGTPGKATVSETGLFMTSFQGNGVADGFPVEQINLRVVGRGKPVPIPEPSSWIIAVIAVLAAAVTGARRPRRW